MLPVYELSGLGALFYFALPDLLQERQTKRTAPPQTLRNSVDMEFVLIPAGTFQMGSEAYGDEKPVHWVRISRLYYLSKHEVTQRQWKAVMGNESPSTFKGDDLPVERVSWHDVEKFIDALNEKEDTDVYRLPTEAEWEYAARSGREKTDYGFGDDVSQLVDYAWYDKNSDDKTHPVGEKLPNDWGLYDMHGNVWEWVQDWYGPYTTAETAATAVEDPVGPDSGSHRVIRGGGWGSDAGNCRSAYRSYWHPGLARRDLGFRLLREVK